MFGFLRGLFAGVARGLAWTARMAIMIPTEIGESMWTAVWRQLFPPPMQQEESTAEVLREVAGMIAGQSAGVGAQVKGEMPAPRPMSAARMRRATEDALRYTTAMLHGERLPSLAHVPADMAHELRRLRLADVEVMHRQLKQVLDIDGAGWWDGPAHKVHAPGRDHDEAPALRYA